MKKKRNRKPAPDMKALVDESIRYAVMTGLSRHRVATILWASAFLYSEELPREQLELAIEEAVKLENLHAKRPQNRQQGSEGAQDENDEDQELSPREWREHLKDLEDWNERDVSGTFDWDTFEDRSEPRNQRRPFDEGEDTW